MQEPSPSERIQRIRIGLTGLAFVFLLVLLGTAVSRSSDSPRGMPATNGTIAPEPDEPLAELGMAPGQSTSDNQSDNRATNAAAR